MVTAPYQLTELIYRLPSVGSAVFTQPLGAGDICLDGIDMDAPVLLEDDLAGRDRVEGVVLALADIESGAELGAALTDDDCAGLGELAAVELHAAVLGV